MNKFFIFTLILLVSLASSKFLEKKLQEEKFMNFINKFNKKYNSVEETAFRFSVFLDNLKKIDELNEKYPTAQFGINKFTDLLKEEMTAKFSSSNSNVQTKPSKISQKQRTLEELPSSFDWSALNKVSSIRDQKECDSSHAIAVVGVLEGQYAIQTNTLITFSEQQLIDCDQRNNGCDGGSALNSFAYLQNNYLQQISSYPVTHNEQRICQQNSQSGQVQVQDIFTVEQDVDVIRQTLVQVGPLATAIDSSSFQHYLSGVFGVTSCSKADSHLLLVGYGKNEQNVEFWKLKASFGVSWGENGYIRISRDVLADCGVSANVSYATAYTK